MKTISYLILIVAAFYCGQVVHKQSVAASGTTPSESSHVKVPHSEGTIDLTNSGLLSEAANGSIPEHIHIQNAQNSARTMSYDLGNQPNAAKRTSWIASDGDQSAAAGNFTSSDTQQNLANAMKILNN